MLSFRVIRSETEIEVRYAETDMMGIVYHANYLPWLEIGRTNMLKEQGYPYTRLEEEGFLLPVIEVKVRYRRPARYDDRLTVMTTMREKPFVKIHLDYEIHRGEELLVTAETIHAFMSPAGRPLKAPEAFMQKISRAFSD